jgi:uncharacterized membrane protein YphA (DoxX/SURF4 family)
VKSLLLLAACSCALAAAIANTDWGWFGIDQSDQTYRAAIAVGALLLAAAFLPWGRPVRRWLEA